jgi:hypothetical protein
VRHLCSSPILAHINTHAHTHTYTHRYEHCGLYLASLDRAYFLCGAKPDGNLNDVVFFSCSSRTWTAANAAGKAPCARTYHTGAAIGNRIFVCGGGLQGSEPVPDMAVHVLDCDALKWSQLRVNGVAPQPRLGHTVVAFEHLLVVFGGMSGSTFFEDVSVLDTVSMTWSVPKGVKAPGGLARSGHAAAVIGNTMYVFGGLGVNASGALSALDDLLALDLRTWQWSRPDVHTAPVTPRLDHTMCAVKLRVRTQPPPPASDNATAPIPASTATVSPVVPLQPAPSASSGSAAVVCDVTDLIGVGSGTANVDLPRLAPDTSVGAEGKEGKEGKEGNSQADAVNAGGQEYELRDGLVIFGGMDTEGNVFCDCLAITF